jgi:hypothetical protein
VPKHEQLSPGDSTSSNMTKQVNMSIPETLFKTQYHLQKWGVFWNYSNHNKLSVLLSLYPNSVATLKSHVSTHHSIANITRNFGLHGRLPHTFA